MTLDSVLASACLPHLYPAVEIDGEAYWDGGFSGNPALYPLIRERLSRDIVIVQINPIVRDELPKAARDIINRVNEISFNASLILELRAIAMTQNLEAERGLDLGRRPQPPAPHPRGRRKCRTSRLQQAQRGMGLPEAAVRRGRGWADGGSTSISTRSASPRPSTSTRSTGTRTCRRLRPPARPPRERAAQMIGVLVSSSPRWWR